MCVQGQLSLIEAQGSLALRAKAHAVIADTYLMATASEHLAKVRLQVEESLVRAVACCDAAQWWLQGEQSATLLACMRHTCGDVEGRDLAAAKALAFSQAQRQAAEKIVV